MKEIITLDKANQPYGFPQLDGSGNLNATGSIYNTKYKVYTALLTQSGGNDSQPIDTGLLTVGVTYRINNDSPGMDFTNVGAPTNTLYSSFVATGITPTSWGSLEGTGNATLTYNNGAPVVTVLENTIGNIWFTYINIGSYNANSNGLFINNKTYVDCKNLWSGQWIQNIFEDYEESDLPNIIGIQNFNIFDDTLANGLELGRIEIRVYN
jgi:hypothetical protein